MKRLVFWLAAVGLAGILAVLLGSLVFLPQWLYPELSGADLSAVTNAEKRVELRQAQSQLQNNARSLLLQGLAGLLVVVGGAATWRQVQVNREGQITERFTRAIDQVGSNNLDVRLGGIYALQRIARNSPADRPTVQFILGAFVRSHAPWPVGSPKGPEHPTRTVDMSLPWLQVRLPDVQAAMEVLGHRPTSSEATALYLSRVDLRSVQLDGAQQLTDTQFRHANLARAWLAGARLDRSDLAETDLRLANLAGAALVETSLRDAHLEGADVRGADLRGADLRGADMRARNLDEAVLTGARADARTEWPAGFSIDRRGVLVSGPETDGPDGN